MAKARTRKIAAQTDETPKAAPKSEPSTKNQLSDDMLAAIRKAYPNYKTIEVLNVSADGKTCVCLVDGAVRKFSV